MEGALHKNAMLLSLTRLDRYFAKVLQRLSSSKFTVFHVSGNYIFGVFRPFLKRSLASRLRLF